MCSLNKNKRNIQNTLENIVKSHYILAVVEKKLTFMTVNNTLGSGGMQKFCVESVPDKTRQE